MKDFATGKNNIMVDMAVSADKTPFLDAEKANDNLQRALNRFLMYHEKEKKAATKQWDQETRLYKRKMERCKTAIRKTRSNFQTIEEEPLEWAHNWTIEQNLRRPKTAGELRKKAVKPPLDPDLMEMTYTFNSIFGDVQKHVVASTSNSSPLTNDSDEPDPLGVYKDSDIVISPKKDTIKHENDTFNDSQTISSQPSSTISFHSSERSSRPVLLRLASMDAYCEIERKRTMSMSDESERINSPVTRKYSSVPSTPDQPISKDQYVSENICGNLSLEMYKSNKLDRVIMTADEQCLKNEFSPPNKPISHPELPNKPISHPELPIKSISHPELPNTYTDFTRQGVAMLGRSKHYEIRRDSICSRRSSLCSQVGDFCSSSNSTLTYRQNESGMAVNKAVQFMQKLHKYSYSQSKCEIMLTDEVSNKKS